MACCATSDERDHRRQARVVWRWWRSLMRLDAVDARRLGAVRCWRVRRRRRRVVGRLRGGVVGRLLRVRRLVLVALRRIAVLVAVHDALRRNNHYRALCIATDQPREREILVIDRARVRTCASIIMRRRRAAIEASRQKKSKKKKKSKPPPQ